MKLGERSEARLATPAPIITTPFYNHRQHPLRALLQRRNTSSARLWRGAPTPTPALQPLDRRTHTHLETLSRLVPRRAHLHGLDYPFLQVCRIRLLHRSPPKRRKNVQSLAHP